MPATGQGLAALAALLAAGAIAAEDWNRFRGPNGTGVSDSGLPPLRPGPQNLAWKVPVPPGLSSPTLSKDSVFLTGVVDGRLVTLCHDRATGEEKWRRAAPEVPFEKVHETGSPATSTPCVNGDRVHVYFGSYGRLCYDLQGNLLWSHAMPTPRSLYGMATSPIVHGGRLILALDTDDRLPGSKLSNSRLVAYERDSGELAWETKRPFVGSGWSTPSIWTHDAGEEVVVLGAYRVTGYEAASGRELWHATGYSKETIAVPLATPDRVLIASSQLGGGPDEVVDVEPFWKALLTFDRNGDGKVGRDEIDERFTYPLRPELGPGHPGYGIPLPRDAEARRKRQLQIFGSMDRDRDGYWEKEEVAAALGGANRRGRPVLAAIRPGGRGNVTDSHVDWTVHKGLPEVPTGLFHDGIVYLARNGGILTAVRASDGEILYRERLAGGGQYSASPVLADGHLYAFSSLGHLSVVKAGAEFEQTRDHPIGEAVHVTPAIGGRTIFVRSAGHLWAFRRPG